VLHAYVNSLQVAFGDQLRWGYPVHVAYRCGLDPGLSTVLFVWAKCEAFEDSVQLLCTQ
jgi:hypothetical protein